ncbi:peptidase [Fibrobacteres bacterium R8-0-B4]
MSVKKIETRFVAADDSDVTAELRESEAEKERFVEGLGVAYGREVELFPGFFETIRAGALSRAVNGDAEIKCFFNHDPTFVLATTRSKPPLELADTPQGVRFRAAIPDTSYGRDLIENLRRRNVRGASFSFRVDKDGDIVTRDDNGNYHREITSAKLYEIGPVTNPAYRQTSAKLRDDGELAAEAEARCKEAAAADAAGADDPGLELKRKKINLLERSC